MIIPLTPPPASGLRLTATPTTVTPPLTAQLVVSCLVPEPRATDVLRYLDVITLSLEGQQLAVVSLHFPAHLVTSLPGWAVEGGIAGGLESECLETL